MSLIEKCVQENEVFRGKILQVRRDDVLDGEGKPCFREIVVHSGGACALYVEDGKVALVRQYRYAYGEDVLEIPAGKLEKGEDPKLAALRELAEEAGVIADPADAELLYVLYPTPGYTNEKIYIYHVKKGERKDRRLDDGELLDTLFLPLDEVKTMLMEGKLNDSKTIVALQHYFMNNR